ncbi:MAG: sulfite exporter TauE/SafE family protein [Candidatus Nanohalobium sp.]
MELLLILAAVALGGLIKGLNGFGYALVSTSLLTFYMPAQEAVALIIIPLIIANIELTAELDGKELKACLHRFKAYIATSFIGVAAGMLFIYYMPSLLLKKAVGLIVLGFVASRTRKISQVFSTAKNFCVENPRIEPLLGLFSGLVFGSTNAGVPIVAYFEELQLPRQKFLSVMALTILGASVIRLGLAYYLGLYSGTNKLLLSVVLGIIGLTAVKIGDIAGQKTSDKVTQNISLLLLTVIGLRLLGTF